MKKSNQSLLFVIFIYFSIYKLVNNKLINCSAFYDSGIILVEKLDEYSNAEFYCDLNRSTLTYLKLNPRSRPILDKDFNFNIVNCEFAFFVFNNFKGFNLQSNILSKKNFKIVEFYNSDFKFIRSKDTTDESFVKERLFVSDIGHYRFTFDVRYFFDVSPFVFRNSMINYLEFKELIDSKIKTNYFTFASIDPFFQLNSTIIDLELEVFKVKISNQILNKHVFEKMQSLTIMKHLEEIETDTFKSFKYLKFLSFNIYSIKLLFNNGILWMKYLNNGVQIDLENSSRKANYSQQMILQLNEVYFHLLHINGFVDEYKYPDEDFCLFRQFPHENYVFPLTKFCYSSCTFAWLYQYHNYFKLDWMPICQVKECNFTELFSKCVKQIYPVEIGQMRADFYYLNDYNYKLKYYDFIISILIYPIVCLLGVISNLLNIIVLRNRTYKKDFRERLYKLMLFNSCVNFSICLIFLLSLMIKCIDPVGSFCIVGIVTKRIYRYILLTMTNYFANVLKTVSNLISLSIALDRYVLSSARPNLLFS